MYFVDQCLYVFVGWQQVGEDWQQFVVEVGDFVVFDFEIEYIEVFVVGVGVGDQCLVVGIFDGNGCWYVVVCMVVEDGVDVVDVVGYFQIDVYVVM